MEEGQPRIMIPMSVQDDIAGQIKMIWDVIKAPLLVPLLNVGVYICLAMCLMLFVERVYMGIVIILVKLFWKKPQQRYRFEPLQDDEESGTSHYPPVLIQIPMFNEKEVLFLSLSLLCSVLFCFFFCPAKIDVCMSICMCCCALASSGLQGVNWGSVWTLMAFGQTRDPSPR